MKPTDRKKLREWLHVRHLDSLLGVLPTAGLTVEEDRERPDLILGHAGGSIGIEVTEFHSAPHRMARYVEQEAVVAEARIRHFRECRVSLMVRVYWNGHDDVVKSERADLASLLVEAVDGNTPGPGEGRVLDRTANDGSFLPAHIDRLGVYRYDDDPDIDWISVRDGTIPALDYGRLVADIARKSALARGIGPVDDLWLVIALSRLLNY